MNLKEKTMSKLSKLNFVLLIVLLIAVFLKPTVENTKTPVVPIVTILPPAQLPVQPVITLERGSVEVKELEINPKRTVFLIGEVAENALVLAAKIKELSDANSSLPIYLVITSPGGSVITGATLLSAIELSKAPVYTICRTMCASMAAITLQYGTKRYATDKTLIMYHPASMSTDGNINEIYSEVVAIKNYVNRIELTVAKKMGLTYDEYQVQSARNIWVDSREGIDHKYIDEIVDIKVKKEKTSLFESDENMKQMNEPIKDDKLKDALKRIKW